MQEREKGLRQEIERLVGREVSQSSAYGESCRGERRDSGRRLRDWLGVK
jgi:hypothetical protein